MLEIEIKMVPFGDRDKTYSLGTLSIARQHPSARITDYRVQYKTSERNHTQKSYDGLIYNFDSNKGVEALVQEALKQIG